MRPVCGAQALKFQRGDQADDVIFLESFRLSVSLHHVPVLCILVDYIVLTPNGDHTVLLYEMTLCVLWHHLSEKSRSIAILTHTPRLLAT